MRKRNPFLSGFLALRSLKKKSYRASNWTPVTKVELQEKIQRNNISNSAPADPELGGD